MSKSSIIYNLDKSITTQKLKGKNIDTVLKNISNFLTNCTTGEIKDPSERISLTSYSAFDNNDDPVIAKRIFDDLTFIFGLGETTPLSYHYPSGEPSLNTKTEWVIDKIDLQKALEFIKKESPMPKFTFGPIQLCFSYKFKLIDPITKDILPNQDSESSLMIWISRSLVCSPMLDFPFASKSEDFDLYIEEITPYLPFELKSKYLRIVTENKSKTGYIYRKL